MNNRRAPHCTAANDPWLREAVGAYLLGALDPVESDRVSAHLAGCASCRAEYGELAELLPLLAAVTESEAVNGPVMPEPAVLGRVLASTAQQPVDLEPDGQIEAYVPQTRPYGRALWRNPAGTSRRGRFALAAAGVVIAVGGAAAGTVMASSGGLPAGSWTASASAVGYPLRANVQVIPGTHGSKIQLKLDDVPAGYSCEMVVVGNSGKHETTGSWTANTEGSFDIPGWSSMAPGLISSVNVDLPDGSTLLTLDHPRN